MFTKRKSLKSTLLTLLTLFMLSMHLHGKNIDSNATKQHKKDKAIALGVKTAIMIYTDTGMLGLKDAVKKCYEDITKNTTTDDIKRCFAIDLTSNYIDTGFSKLMKFPPNEFFHMNFVKFRLIKGLEKISIDAKDIRDTISNTWVPNIVKEYEATMLQ